MVIIDAMAVVQAMGKPPWVGNGRDLANQLIEVIDSESEGATEVHVVVDRYDIPDSLKEGTHQKRTGTSRAVVYKITVDAVIYKITMKDLLSCSQNKETLSTFLAAQLIECKKDIDRDLVKQLVSGQLPNNSRHLDELTHEPPIWQCDTGQWLSCFDSCQLTIS